MLKLYLKVSVNKVYFLKVSRNKMPNQKHMTEFPRTHRSGKFPILSYKFFYEFMLDKACSINIKLGGTALKIAFKKASV
jgi:hypothetical protein